MPYHKLINKSYRCIFKHNWLNGVPRKHGLEDITKRNKNTWVFIYNLSSESVAGLQISSFSCHKAEVSECAHLLQPSLRTLSFASANDATETSIIRKLEVTPVIQQENIMLLIRNRLHLQDLNVLFQVFLDVNRSRH